MERSNQAIKASPGFARLMEREIALFEERTGRSKAFHEASRKSLFMGVPMPWMLEWPNNPYPIHVDKAKDSRIWDIDGNEYVDFCFGDTGSMFGHSPDVIIEAVNRLIPNGITTMFPSTDAAAVSDLLVERFQLPYWQLALSATDANRFVIRLVRGIKKRPKILVFHGCYHGSLDETLVQLDADGKVIKKCPLIDANPSLPADASSAVVEFNDIPALEAALAKGDVAAVLAEPIMTNCGMVLPEEGYHDKLRELTRKHDTYLIIDETHTISHGYGGYTRAHDLDPDFLVFGKAMAGGITIAGYGFTEDVTLAHEKTFGHLDFSWGEYGVGGTLTANSFSVGVMRAALERLATREHFDHMLRLGDKMADGLEALCEETALPWSVTRAGARAELQFMPRSPRNGTEALNHFDLGLIGYTHLYLLNRGIIITPFHNMMLISPLTSNEDVERLIDGWRDCLTELAEATAD